jgi:ketosteroid isomerase-like protein
MDFNLSQSIDSTIRKAMNSTPHLDSLKRLYQLWHAGDIASIEAEFPAKLTFEIKGKSALAGKHGLSAFARLFGAMKEHSQGTFQTEVHDILVSDRHGMVLSTHKLKQADQPVEYRSVHVWRFENGKPIAGYEYLRDQYQFDQIWQK